MKILIGAPVRQDEETFEKYLNSLKKLKKGNNEVHYFFILHNSPNLKKYLLPHEYTEYQSESIYKKDDTHHWTNETLRDVTNMKNMLLKKVLDEKYDYFFLVDSDLILNENTLYSLLMHNKDIISECFWTKWNSDRQEEPNAWIYDFYSFDNDLTMRTWKQRGVFEVGGTGACILIKRNVIEKGVNYNPIHNVSFSIWEDRAFCIRASVHGFKIYMDTHFPPEHLYRKK